MSLPDAINQAIKDRLSADTFVSSFVISFLVINWRILIILLSLSGESADRIREIEGYISNCYAWLRPLGASLFYTFAWPWVRDRIEKYNFNMKMRLSNFMSATTLEGSIQVSEVRDIFLYIAHIESLIRRWSKERNNSREKLFANLQLLYIVEEVKIANTDKDRITGMMSLSNGLYENIKLKLTSQVGKKLQEELERVIKRADEESQETNLLGNGK